MGFKKPVRKGENAGNPVSKREIVILSTFDLSSANASNLVTSKIFSFGKVFSQNINPLPDNKILNWSKLKQIADDIFKCRGQI